MFKSEVGKLAWTTDLNTLVDCFDAYLGSWEVPSKSRHSVLMFDGTSVKLEVSRSNNLNHFCSKSVGGVLSAVVRIRLRYYSRWHTKGRKVIFPKKRTSKC